MSLVGLAPLRNSSSVTSTTAFTRNSLIQSFAISKCAASPSTTTFIRGIRYKRFKPKPKRNQHIKPQKSPFVGRLEQMPFKCYQLAMEVIRKDREDKKARIDVVSQRLKRATQKLKDTETKLAATAEVDGKAELERQKKETALRVQSFGKRLEQLKVLHDINSPRVRYNWWNGRMDMDKPVYRYLAKTEWSKLRRPTLIQRLETMDVYPDVLPKIVPTVDVRLRFKGKEIKPGDFVVSKNSEKYPSLKIIPFEAGEKLCTIAVIDPDVPDVENDSFRNRLHWLVTNVSVNHKQTQAIGTGSSPSTLVSTYLPPHVQRGLPYHRYCLVVFQQPGRIDAPLEPVRDDFNMRSFQDRYLLKVIGAFLWRGKWDKGTRSIMQKHALPGWDLRYIRKRA